MFIFGQLFLAAILLAFPLGYFFGIWWYIGSTIYLFIANVMTYHLWQKIFRAQLKAVSYDISNEAFKIREDTKKVVTRNGFHPYVICVLVAFAPLAIIMLLSLMAGNHWVLKKLIELFKEESPPTQETVIKLLWLEDLRDNGLFRTKL